MSTVVKTERLKHIAALAERCGQNQIVGFAASEVSAIAAELLELRRAPVVPDALPENDDELHQRVSELYHAQEKRLFKLAQRIKGPSFDKYAHSPSQAINVLETAIFGPKANSGKSELLQRAEKIAEDAAALSARYAIHYPSEQDIADRVLRVDITYPPVPRPVLTRCVAGRDGECSDPRCPQLRDNEPVRTGRHCPLDHSEDDE